MYVEVPQDVLLLLRERGGRRREAVNRGVLREQGGGSVVRRLRAVVLVLVAYIDVEICGGTHLVDGGCEKSREMRRAIECSFKFKDFEASSACGFVSETVKGVLLYCVYRGPYCTGQLAQW